MKRKENKEKVNLTPGGRVKKILELEGITATEACQRMTGRATDGHVAVQTLSNIINDHKRLTNIMAKKIIDLFPEKKYRELWLLGYDDFMTETEKQLAELGTQRTEFIEFKKEMDNAADNQNRLLKAVADILALYGVNWNGSHEMKKYRKDRTIANGPAGSYQGENFYSWELEDIAFKLYEIAGIELNHAAQVKRDFRNDMDFFKLAEKET